MERVQHKGVSKLKKNWRDDSPWNKLNKKDDITTAAYVINPEIDSADKGINGYETKVNDIGTKSVDIKEN